MVQLCTDVKSVFLQAVDLLLDLQEESSNARKKQADEDEVYAMSLVGLRAWNVVGNRQAICSLHFLSVAVKHLLRL